MKIYANTYEGKLAHNQVIRDPDSPSGWSYRTFTEDATDMVHNPNGVAAKYDIWSGTNDFGYIQCEVGFTQYNGVHQSSIVFANYAHATIGFSGSISLSSSGSIGLGAGKSVQQYSVACNADVN